MSEVLLRVAVEAPLPEALIYLANPESLPRRGQSVLVPLGKRQTKGVVLGAGQQRGEYKLKNIGDVLPQRPLVPELYLRWLEWLADYYMHPIGQVTALAFPPLETQKRARASKKAPVVKSMASTPAPTLTEEQNAVINAMKQHKDFSVHLLHGVTGSGKTEVYLQMLADVVAQGQQGLVLVPEISLTPQLLDRFAARFGDKIAVLHSHLTDREKTEQWWAAVRGEKPILIGARSALFCPLEKLGLIIIDEEHEPSFKQDEKLKYHARDAAVMLAKLANCPIILGSATPSLESWQHARAGRYHLHRMQSRVADRQLPQVSILDLRLERRARREQEPDQQLPFWLSQQLYDSLVATFERGEQAALFLNRRGIAQSALCGDCGWTFECPNCAISLTVHGHNHLVCHYCDYTDRLAERCPQCQSSEVQPLGLGTELIEKDMARLFPEQRLARADRDEVQSREALEELIRAVEKREIDILIGTQMIAKGLDFPGLTLVGVVMADVGFALPDFRASERSFQLLTQVSGRAGRHSEQPGQVIVQTYNPEHPAVVSAQAHSFEKFADEELLTRQELSYPPFARLALIRLQGPTLDKAENAAKLLQRRAQSLVASRDEYRTIRVLGPAPAPIAKLRGKFRFQALLKGQEPAVLRAFCRQLLADGAWLPSGTKAAVDIDPVNML
ncbi:MAG: primosomal protein N' [Bdellovibrionales bacterium]